MGRDVRSLASRRFLLIVACISILVITVVAYGYKLYAEGLGLKGQAIDDGKMHFTFTWGPRYPENRSRNTASGGFA